MKQLNKLFSADAIRRTIRIVSLRFPFPFTFALLITVWGIYMTFEWNSDCDYIFESVNWTLTEGFLLTLAINLWCEFSGKKRILKPGLLCATALVAVDLIVLLARNGSGTGAEPVGRLAFASALIAAILFLPAISRYSRKQLWTYTIGQFEAVATAVCLGIVMVLSCLIIFGTLAILFNLDNYRFCLTAICIFGWLMPCVIYLSKIPNQRKTAAALLPPKTFAGAFCKNIALPIVLIYTIILYVYAAKILFTWTLPNGSVTWMVTGLMVTVLITLYGLQRYSFGDNFSESAIRIASLVRQWTPRILLPLLVLMSVGLICRIREYGITVSRLYVAAFNIWSYSIIIHLILKRSANLNVVAASFALVFAIVSMIPGLNFTSITTRVLRGEVIEALHDAGVERLPITKEEVSRALAKMDRQDARNTASKIEYLDDWNDHSNISDIVRSDSKIYAFSILPEKYDHPAKVVEPLYELLCDKTVAIPDGCHAVRYQDSFKSIHLIGKNAGITEFSVEGYRIKFNIDSLKKNHSGDEVLTMPAVKQNGDSATIVFTSFNIYATGTNNDIPEISHSTYYIFTK